MSHKSLNVTYILLHMFFKAYLCTFRERMVILDGIDTPLSRDCSLTCRTFYRNRGYSTSLRRAFCNPKDTTNHS